MRATPFIDGWRATTLRALASRGRKAELARHLSERYGGEARVWEKNLQAILRRQVPSGELVLAIDAWLACLPGKATDDRSRAVASRTC